MVYLALLSILIKRSGTWTTPGQKKIWSILQDVFFSFLGDIPKQTDVFARLPDSSQYRRSAIFNTFSKQLRVSCRAGRISWVRSRPRNVETLRCTTVRGYSWVPFHMFFSFLRRTISYGLGFGARVSMALLYKSLPWIIGFICCFWGSIDVCRLAILCWIAFS